jgi:hypothetical protein
MSTYQQTAHTCLFLAEKKCDVEFLDSEGDSLANFLINQKNVKSLSESTSQYLVQDNFHSVTWIHYTCILNVDSSSCQHNVVIRYRLVFLGMQQLGNWTYLQ